MICNRYQCSAGRHVVRVCGRQAVGVDDPTFDDRLVSLGGHQDCAASHDTHRHVKHDWSSSARNSISGRPITKNTRLGATDFHDAWSVCDHDAYEASLRTHQRVMACCTKVIAVTNKNDRNVVVIGLLDT